MKHAKIDDIYEQLPVSSQRTFPPPPFPSKYVHCAMNSLQHCVEAVLALRAAGHDAGNIHVMASWDFIEAVERRYKRRGLLARMMMCFTYLIDDGFGDIYLHKAHSGYHILTVRIVNKEQIEQVRDLLARHYAHSIKYIDTWTVADLLPLTKHSARKL